MLVRHAKKHGIELRQSYTRLAKAAAVRAGRYAHARQFRRMRRELKRLRTFLGRVLRDIGRKIAGKVELERTFTRLFGLVERLLAQKPKDKNKLYSLHAPEYGATIRMRRRIASPKSVPRELCRCLTRMFSNASRVVTIVFPHLVRVTEVAKPLASAPSIAP